MSCLRIALFGLLVGFCGLPAAHAVPTDYTISFGSEFGGPAPTSGSFTYDSESPNFTNFVVVWNGNSFDFTNSANNYVPPPSGAGPACLDPIPQTPETYFTLLIDPTACLQEANAVRMWRAVTIESTPYVQFYWFNPALNWELTLTASPDLPPPWILFRDGGSFTVGNVGGGPTNVPEPGSLTLSLSALLALAFVGKKRLAVARGRTK